jgi:isochorismate hydrolase
MPEERQLPANTAHWRIIPERCALLIHDMQNYFVDMFPSRENPRTTLIENIARMRDACRDAGIPVTYTAQPGDMTDEQRGLLREFWGPGMTSEPRLKDIASPLAPLPGDQVFTKWRYSAFHRTSLLEFLRDNNREQIIICGVYAHIGCLMTAADAFANDIRAFLLADAVADFSAYHHRLALEYAATRCSMVLRTDAILASVSVAAARS